MTSQACRDINWTMVLAKALASIDTYIQWLRLCSSGAARLLKGGQRPRLRPRPWRLNPLYQIGGPRSIQLARSFYFGRQTRTDTVILMSSHPLMDSVQESDESRTALEFLRPLFEMKRIPFDILRLRGHP